MTRGVPLITETPHPFQTLTPGFVMDAVESQGFRCDCRIFALNSYENRDCQVGIEEGGPLIAKFYRPGRWSDAQIREEHVFCFELVECELPVVAPLCNPVGESLFQYEGFRFALYPRQGGHAPEFDNLDNLLILGRTLGRMHSIGAVRPFRHRPHLDSASFGQASVALLRDNFITDEGGFLWGLLGSSTVMASGVNNSLFTPIDKTADETIQVSGAIDEILPHRNEEFFATAQPSENASSLKIVQPEKFWQDNYLVIVLD